MRPVSSKKCPEVNTWTYYFSPGIRSVSRIVIYSNFKSVRQPAGFVPDNECVGVCCGIVPGLWRPRKFGAKIKGRRKAIGKKHKGRTRCRLICPDMQKDVCICVYVCAYVYECKSAVAFLEYTAW